MIMTLKIRLDVSQCTSCSHPLLKNTCRKDWVAGLEQLAEHVASDCKRVVDVSAYLERIHIQYLNHVKAKEHMSVLHSQILPKFFSKLSDGRHVGSDLLDCAEWQQIGIKAAEWQILRDKDASRVTWDDVYLDLATT